MNLFIHIAVFLAVELGKIVINCEREMLQDVNCWNEVLFSLTGGTSGVLSGPISSCSHVIIHFPLLPPLLPFSLFFLHFLTLLFL